MQWLTTSESITPAELYTFTTAEADGAFSETNFAHPAAVQAASNL